MVDHQLVKWSKYCYKILNRYGRASFIDVYVALSHLKYVRCLQPRYLNDNSTRILSTNQIYEIDQYGPITFVLKKLPRKFSLVKIATKNFQQNVSTIFYFIEFFNLCSVNCHAEYKLVGTKLPETFPPDHSYLFCDLKQVVISRVHVKLSIIWYARGVFGGLFPEQYLPKYVIFMKK
jgi:hypothetical protein